MRSLPFTFFLTTISDHLIYESHCGLTEIANSMLRENRSMKNATKKAAGGKKTAGGAKKAAKKGGKK